MATQEKTWNVANRLHSMKDSDNPEVNHIIAGADEIYDDTKEAKQSDINAQTDAALADRYTKAETYSKEQLDALITTPDVNYVTVATFADLPQPGEADTIYRVSFYDGTQVDASKYALYAWNGVTYQLLAVRSAIGEVFDVSEYNTGATYGTLASALAAVPASVQRGGMSIKFILRTNTGSEEEPVYNDEYVQYRLMKPAWSNDDDDWQGVTGEIKAGSRNLVKSGGVFNKTNSIEANVAAITGNPGDIPFIVGSVSGMITDTQLKYAESDSRLRVEMPTDKISTIKAKTGYKFAICAFEDKIPTTKRQRLGTGFNTSINVQNAISSITEFNPNRIVIVIANTGETVITGVESLDEVIKVTYLDNTLVDLSNIINVVNSDTKFAYIKGNHSYTTNSITFGQDSILVIKNVKKESPIAITFAVETTYTFNTVYGSLIFDGGTGTVSVSQTANIKETDVSLLIWSDEFVGGALYNDYQYYIYNTLKIVFTVGDVIYDNGRVLFKAGSALYYHDYRVGSNRHIDFDEDTEYSFTTNKNTLVLRDDNLLVVNTPEILKNDIVILYFKANGEIVSGALYPESISKAIPAKLTNIPFKKGGYSGVSSDTIVYATAANRLRVELPTKNLATIKTKGDYKIAGCLFEDSIPTSKFLAIYTSMKGNTTVYVQEKMLEVSDFIPNKIIIVIAKSDNSDWGEVDSVDDFIEITYSSLPASVLNDNSDVNVRETKAVKIGVIEGWLSSNSGYSAKIADDVNLTKHTPRMIRIVDEIKILNDEILSGYIYYYNKNKDYLGYVTISSLTNKTIVNYYNAYYIRITFNTTDTDSVLPADYVLLESKWENPNNIEEYLGLPSDEGFVNLAFPVRVNLNIAPSTVVSEITSQYTKSTNYGVLHLPASYSADGKATPLIIYLHGQSERYGYNSVRFGDNVRYSPEWSAAGYAQMDVDMFPKMFNLSGAQAGLCYDTLCVEAAYRWVIEHYNIRRDGVYLFGRSRGGQAVFSILGQYNSVKLPVICALSNAGANTLFLYKLFRQAPTTPWWNAYCLAMGLSALNPPTIDTTKLIVKQPTIVSFLRDNINVWWKKTMTGFPMIVENPTQYKTPVEIFDLLVSSYNDASEPGKTFIEDFVESCKYHSPVPLRFDWCVGDTVQTRYSPGTTNVDNYGLAGMKAFVNSDITGNSIYREWPECTGGEPHYHEKFNLLDGDYTLPNGAVVTNPSMAQVEWLLWAQSHDNRDL